jgi:hypothetical protein
MIWLLSGASDNPEDKTVIERHGAKALHSVVKSLMHAIWTEDQDAQKDMAHRMIQIAKPWTIRRWSESRHVNGKPFVLILKENARLVDLEWTEEV